MKNETLMINLGPIYRGGPLGVEDPQVYIGAYVSRPHTYIAAYVSRPHTYELSCHTLFVKILCRISFLIINFFLISFTTKLLVGTDDFKIV